MCLLEPVDLGMCLHSVARVAKKTIIFNFLLWSSRVNDFPSIGREVQRLDSLEEPDESTTTPGILED